MTKQQQNNNQQQRPATTEYLKKNRDPVPNNKRDKKQPRITKNLVVHFVRWDAYTWATSHYSPRACAPYSKVERQLLVY